MKKPMMFFQADMGGGYGQVASQALGGIGGTFAGLGETIFGLLGGFGSKPKVAPFRPPSWADEISGAATGFTGALPDITAASNAYRNLLLGQQGPQYSADIAALGTGAGQMLATGEQWLSGDPGAVLSNAISKYVGQGGAASVLGSGDIGALGNIKGNLSYNVMQDLMTRGEQAIQGGGALTQEFAGLQSQDILNPSFFMVSPQQREAQDWQTALIRRNIAQQRYNVAAQPDPTMLGLMMIANQVGSSWGSGGGGGSSGGFGDFMSNLAFGQSSQGGSGLLGNY
jgi:hypothetical protein